MVGVAVGEGEIAIPGQGEAGVGWSPRPPRAGRAFPDQALRARVFGATVLIIRRHLRMYTVLLAWDGTDVS
jgi:hypothetical protein